MGINSENIRAAVRPYGYQVKTVSIRRLPEAQDAVGGLIRKGLIDGQLSGNWRFSWKNSGWAGKGMSFCLKSLKNIVIL